MPALMGPGFTVTDRLARLKKERQQLAAWKHEAAKQVKERKDHRGCICSTVLELGTPKPYLVWFLGT